MTSSRWRAARDLFERALEEEPSDVAVWVQREADGDQQLRDEVLSLLAHHSSAGSFLSAPVVERMPELLTDDLSLEPGVSVGPFTIVRELGRGGMGRVYLATDTKLGRTVALKALAPRLTGSPLERERLRREARAAALLSHPGICTVYSLEDLDGELFIVSEFIDGRTLREEIAGGARPSAASVTAAAHELTAALAAAHTKGLTHRDLKPENVMRGRDGRLKILDFGLARVDAPVTDDEPVAVTQPGALVGTPAYMAPEQLNGLRADPRTDVFALGVLLYEYACGTHPFAAATPLALAARVLESDVQPIDHVRPDLQARVAAMIERCLQKAPGDRFPSAVDAALALSREDIAAPGGRRARWWRTHQLVIVALYFIACVFGWRIKEWLHSVSDPIFLLLGIATTIGCVYRFHLMFTERVNRPSFAAERGRAEPVTLGVDLVMAVALGIDGVLIAPTGALIAVFTFALAVGLALARIVLEPVTTASTFRDHP